MGLLAHDLRVEGVQNAKAFFFFFTANTKVLTLRNVEKMTFYGC